MIPPCMRAQTGLGNSCGKCPDAITPVNKTEHQSHGRTTAALYTQAHAQIVSSGVKRGR